MTDNTADVEDGRLSVHDAKVYSMLRWIYSLLFVIILALGIVIGILSR